MVCVCVCVCVSALANDENRAKYIDAVVEGTEASWCPDDDAESKWELIRDSVVKAANNTLGLEGRQQPEWFRDNQPILQELITKRNSLFHSCLLYTSPSPRDATLSRMPSSA